MASEQTIAFGAGNKIIEEKVNLLNKRIEKIEGLLLRMTTPEFADKKLGALEISKKLEKLLDYRNDSKIEIAALKERVAALEAGKKPNPKKYKKIEEDLSKYDERIHNLVYRAGKS